MFLYLNLKTVVTFELLSRVTNKLLITMEPVIIRSIKNKGIMVYFLFIENITELTSIETMVINSKV